MIKTILGKVMLVPKGEWISTESYSRLDFVTRNGNSYVALKDNQNALVTDVDTWGVLAEKGVDGVKGDTGERGAAGMKGDKGEIGDTFTYDMLTPEQVAALKGEKGDKGDTGKDGGSAYVIEIKTVAETLSAEDLAGIADAFSNSTSLMVFYSDSGTYAVVTGISKSESTYTLYTNVSTSLCTITVNATTGKYEPTFSRGLVTTDIYNDLLSTDINKALSAAQGKVVNEKLDYTMVQSLENVESINGGVQIVSKVRNLMNGVNGVRYAAILTATPTTHGVMSFQDKVKLDGIDAKFELKADKSSVYTTSEIDDKIANIHQFSRKIVTELPETGNADTLYLLAKEGTNDDVYNEYLWDGEKFELIGTTAVDLSAYSTTVLNDTKYAAKSVETMKVDKVDGMTLSSNDYSTEDKTKLSGIDDGATKYVVITLPTLDMSDESRIVSQEDLDELEFAKTNNKLVVVYIADVNPKRFSPVIEVASLEGVTQIQFVSGNTTYFVDIYEDTGQYAVITKVHLTNYDVSNSLSDVSEEKVLSAKQGSVLDNKLDYSAFIGHPAPGTSDVAGVIIPFVTRNYKSGFIGQITKLIPLATTTANGVFSAVDKVKLDSVAAGATPNVIEKIALNGNLIDINNKTAQLYVDFSPETLVLDPKLITEDLTSNSNRTLELLGGEEGYQNFRSAVIRSIPVMFKWNPQSSENEIWNVIGYKFFTTDYDGDDGLVTVDTADLTLYRGSTLYCTSIKNTRGRTTSVYSVVHDKSEEYYTPTLSTLPDETTLTYTKDGVVKTFGIGHIARVFDTIENEYSFYQLYDVADGKAVWKISGSGGNVQFNETVKIMLSGNQLQPDTALNGTVIHVKYGDIDNELIWNGVELSTTVPMNFEYTIEPGAVPGYTFPEKQTYTAIVGNTRSVYFYYDTQVTTINVTVDEGDLTDQTIAVTNSVDDSVIYTGAAGTSVVNIPIDIQFTVTLSSKVGYIKTEVSDTATEFSKTITVGYTKIKTAAIVFDMSITDPSNITGDVNTGITAQILSKWRRCLCKKTADSKVTISYLKNDDSNFYEDGSAAKLDGTEGDVMVYKPEFYYKYEKISDTKFSYKLSANNADGAYIHSPSSLIGAYKAKLISNKLYSRSGSTPITNNSVAIFDTQVKARGAGYQLIDYEQHCMIALMLYAKYGNRNLQAVLGAGGATYSPATATGTTNQKGNNDTVNETSGYVNGLGIEGVFGGFFEWVSGVAIQDRVWTITNQDGTTRTSNAHSADGWITNVAAEAGPHFDMIPTGVGGSETTHYSDYYTQSAGSRVLARSYHSSNTSGGVACTFADHDSSSADSYLGSRLAFRGEIIEESNVEAFKALPITN